MYLLPWQIFILGCVCGIFIAFIIMVIALIRIATRGGVRVTHKIVERKEDDDDGGV